MPEGPELHLSSIFINRICKNFTFSGQPKRNPVHKSDDIVWNEDEYTITAKSKGKELMLHLLGPASARNDKKDYVKPKSTTILFTFGMSGKFEFTSANELEKHSHLSFFTKSNPKMCLSFVDYRRFGRWYQDSNWTASRGPCIMQEYSFFLQNVERNLQKRVFDKPICEVLLNQEYFSGIGNYLRAEILYRCKIPPFEKARSVIQLKENVKGIKHEVKEEHVTKVKEELQDVKVKEEIIQESDKNNKRNNGRSAKRKMKNCNSDDVSHCKQLKVEVTDSQEKEREIDAEQFLREHFEEKSQQLLRLCHSVPLEVVDLGCQKSSLSEMYYDASDSSFSNWLQCYYQPGMKNLVDHNKRTIWFSGPAGPMAPKDGKERKSNKKMKSSKSEVKTDETNIKEENQEQTEKPKVRLTRKLLSDSTKSKKTAVKTSKVETDAKNNKSPKRSNTKSKRKHSDVTEGQSPQAHESHNGKVTNVGNTKPKRSTRNKVA